MLNSRLFILFIYLLSACLVGCLLAYPVYVISTLEFDRALSRSILLCVVLLFYPAYQYLQYKNLSDIGLISENCIKTSVNAWLIGLLMLIPISIFYLSCAFRVWEPVDEQSFTSASTVIVLAILSGFVIGLIEETLFRGVIQSSLLKKYSSVVSVVVVNLIYSSVHFLEAPEAGLSTEVHWYSGFTLFASAFAPLLSAHLIWDSWLALFLAGIFLSVVCLRSGNLFWCIGIHAGWVTHIKVLKKFTDKDNTAYCSQWAGSYDNYVGVLSIIWIGTLLFIWWLMSRNKAT